MKKISRRRFIGATGTGIAAAGTLSALRPETLRGSQASNDEVPRTGIELTINGKRHRLDVEDRWTLAEVLRDHLSLTGTRIGCDRAQCGACTVLLDGVAVYACSTLAVWADGRSVTTVEGLADGDRLDPLQEAFIEHDAPQCGFCTSGQLMSAKALLNENPAPSWEEARQGLAGNLCRCSNYNRYVESVLAAARGEGGRG